MRNTLKAGFTLVEVLVTMILLAILVTVVFPVVVQQIDDAEPTKAANDMANIRTGIETFRVNVRPRFPYDLEDLIHAISTGENYLTGSSGYTADDTDNWNGPYIDASLLETLDASSGTITTGYGLDIQNALTCYDASGNTDDGTTCGAGDFVSLEITGASFTGTGTGTEFDALDELIDNSDGHTAGKLRALDGGDGTWTDGNEVIYYLAVPYKS